MEEDEVIRDRRGREVRVTRIPARGKAKFKRKTFDSSMSPFERFKDSNQGGSKITSI